MTKRWSYFDLMLPKPVLFNFSSQFRVLIRNSKMGCCSADVDLGLELTSGSRGRIFIKLASVSLSLTGIQANTGGLFLQSFSLILLAD